MKNQPATLAIRELRPTPGITRFPIAVYSCQGATRSS